MPWIDIPVPLIDPLTGHFPDRFAPPSVLIDKEAAASSAADALLSEGAALEHKNAAALSESNAGSSAADALLSEQAAALSESNAGSSAADALLSEQASALSEQNAGISAGEALQSKLDAAQSVTDALNAVSDAIESENAAALSELNAGISAADSLLSKNAAAGSAGEALVSKNAAADSAAAALVSENNAAATLAGAVKHNAVQTLTEAAQLQARTNIGVKSLVLKNLLTNGDMAAGNPPTGWSKATAATIVTVSGRMGITAGAQWDTAYQSATTVTGNKYYVAAACEGTTANFLGPVITGASVYLNGTGVQRPSSVFTAQAATTTIQMGDNRTSGWTQFFMDNAILIDLTATFGAGNEPTAAEMDRYLAATHTNSWFDGLATINWQLWETVTRDSVRNLVTNGDFSNGTTGWLAGAGSTVATTGGVLADTGTGSQASTVAYQPVAKRDGQKYYAAAQIRVTNAVCTSLGLGLGGDNAGTIVPAANTWNVMSKLITALTDGADLNLTFTHSYADAATASGKVMEVKYAIAINLTQTFGAGREPSKQEMDLLLAQYPNSWFNGVRTDFLSRWGMAARNKWGNYGPEGYVTAPIGTMYHDVLGTGGVWSWRKRTGSGNTGWVPWEADAVFLPNRTAPATPVAGGITYVAAGELFYKGSSGNVTKLGRA